MDQLRAVPTVIQVAEVLALAPTPWGHEGAVRALIRSQLCLAGSQWVAADRAARRLVRLGRAHNKVGTPVGWDLNYLPTIDGDPRWRECWICGQTFCAAREKHVFCGPACRERGRRIEREQLVYTRCGLCNEPIEHPTPRRRYCSQRCMNAVWQARRSERRAAERHLWAFKDCVICGVRFEVGARRADQKYCSRACNQRAAHERRKLNGHASNGHAHDLSADSPRPELARGNGRDHGYQNGAGRDPEDGPAIARATGDPGRPIEVHAAGAGGD